MENIDNCFGCGLHSWVVILDASMQFGYVDTWCCVNAYSNHECYFNTCSLRLNGLKALLVSMILFGSLIVAIWKLSECTQPDEANINQNECNQYCLSAGYFDQRPETKAFETSCQMIERINKRMNWVIVNFVSRQKVNRYHYLPC